MQVIGLIWGPWDEGQHGTYFSEPPTPLEYKTAMRAYLGSPGVKKYPLIRALGKLQRAEAGFNLTRGRKTPFYKCAWEAVRFHQGSPRRALSNWHWRDEPFDCKVPHITFEYDGDVKDLKKVLTKPPGFFGAER